jgi:hypothetical protein
MQKSFTAIIIKINSNCFLRMIKTLLHHYRVEFWGYKTRKDPLMMFYYVMQNMPRGEKFYEHLKFLNL